METIYYNLTQCAGSDNNIRYVYFRSTDIERKNWKRLLWSVPDEWFYQLYRGNEIKIIDKSTHGRGKIERIFVPVLIDFLNTIWFSVPIVHKNMREHFAIAIEQLSDSALRRKYMYWKHKITEVKISAVTIRVPKEYNPLEE